MKAIRILVALSALAGPALAAAPPEQVFAAGVTALERGAWDEAIDQLELLADQGFVHPDASFNRAVAYIERARTPAARPGDLGRAAAALTETLELRPGDAEAELALERVQSEIARRRARDGDQPVMARPSLARAVAGLLPERVWAIAAAVGSLALTVGLALAWGSHRRRRLAGWITASIGGVLFVLFGALVLAARHHRLTSQPAVVVVPEARLLDDQGSPVAAGRENSSVPEGASVYVLERRGPLARVEWGTTEGWVAISQLRVIPRAE